MPHPGRLASAVIALFGIIFGATEASAGDDLGLAAQTAYIYAFPLHETYRVRYLAAYSPGNPRRVPINQFRHVRALSDHTARAVTTPNNDTLYSTAFLDLSRGALILEVPELGDRYYSLAFMDPFTDNFAYVGTRTTGGQAGKYLITGPEWAGSAPPGMQRISAPSNFVWLLGRFLVDPPSDVVHVVRLQDSLTPVSACRSAVAPRV